jgi:hypothetical protein
VTRPQWDTERDKPAFVRTAESYAGATEVDRLAIVLMAAWGNVDPASTVAQHPTSFVATFAEMARDALEHLRAAGWTPPAEPNLEQVPPHLGPLSIQGPFTPGDTVRHLPTQAVGEVERCHGDRTTVRIPGRWRASVFDTDNLVHHGGS